MGCTNQKNVRTILPQSSTIKIQEKIINQHFDLQITRNTFLKIHYGPVPETYKLLETIGQGAFAQVKKCFHTPTESLRAIKRVSKTGLLNRQFSLDQSNLNEIQILRMLDHPNIIKCLDFFQDQKHFYIVTQLCQGGELLDRIIKMQGFTQNTVAVLIKQLLSVLAYCHSKSIIHRDIKPQNLLFDTPGSLTLKVADFGSACRLNRRRKLQGVFGSAFYIAPEVFTNTYDQKCDIWSVGIIMFILLTGKIPYQGNTQQEILSNVRNSPLNISKELFPKVSKQALSLLKSLLIVDPLARISAVSALSHPWITLSKQPKIRSIHSVMENLRSFNRKGKLYQAIKVFIATQISTEQEAIQLREAFRALDTNNDGLLSREQLLEYFRHSHSPKEAIREVQALMRKVDRDNSGYIDYSEFLAATVEISKEVNYFQIKHAFSKFDLKNQGFITTEQLKEMLSGEFAVENQVWEDILNEVDLNGDGKIDVEEFVKLVYENV